MSSSQYIIGISAFYHDSAVAVLKDGQILCAAQEERFTRKKHDASFPSNALQWCLEYSGIPEDSLLAVVFYDKPLLKFERLLETYYAFAPKGFRSFYQAMPVWIKEKVFLKKIIREEIEKAAQKVGMNVKLNGQPTRLLFSEHHLSHAASAFYPSPFQRAAVLTVDGVGEWDTASIFIGNGEHLEKLQELHFPHSWGLLYSAFTYYCGFRVNSGEYKLMGLAPYGNPEGERTREFIDKIKSHLLELKDDGSLWLNMDYFDYATGLRMVNEEKWTALFGIPPRRPETEITSAYCDLALAVQRITEEGMLKMAKHVKKLTGEKYLTLAGGVALNCVANGKILRSRLFDDIWIQPAAGDAGGALGAAYAAWHIYYNQKRANSNGMDHMQGSYLGPEYSDTEIEQVARRFKAVYKKFHNEDELCEVVAQKIADGYVVGWFQGRMEWGPRALGNRSILGDARNPETQRRLNLKIKFRESFRPFAPSVLDEKRQEYFDLDRPSPYMLLVADVKKERRKPVPPNYHQMEVRQKLYHTKSDLPAITHVDFSARIQTVHRETNPRFWKLLKAFEKLTGYGVIVNTSFNVRGEPIVRSPEEAYRCFMRTEMDYLVMGNYVFDKKEQPEWKESRDWKKDLILD